MTLHTYPEPDQEDQTDAFGAEFLMPPRRSGRILRSGLPRLVSWS